MTWKPRQSRWRRPSSPRWSRAPEPGCPRPGRPLRRERPAIATPPSRPRRVVLLVAADRFARRTLGCILENEDYHVCQAGEDDSALRFLDRTPRPDLILLDLPGPLCPCRDLVQRLHSDPALTGIPILVVSAMALPVSGTTVTCLEKPLAVPVLLQAIRRLLSG